MGNYKTGTKSIQQTSHEDRHTHKTQHNTIQHNTTQYKQQKS